MTLALVHNEDGRVVLGCVRERRPPFSPENVVAELAVVLGSYGPPDGSHQISPRRKKPADQTFIVCIAILLCLGRE